MILSIFITILILSVLLLVVGYYAEKPWLVVTGYVFLFLLGIAFVTGVEYQSGSTIVEAGATTTVTDVYTTYNNKTIGLFFSIVFAFAFIVTLLEHRARREP